MNDKTLANGWVRVRGTQGVGWVHDPELARLLAELRRLDYEVIADCTEHRR